MCSQASLEGEPVAWPVTTMVHFIPPPWLCDHSRMQQRFMTPAFNPTPQGPCFCGSEKAFGDCCGSRAADRPPPVGVHVKRGFLEPGQCAEWVSVLDRQKGEQTGTFSGGEVRVNEARVTERVFLGPVEESVTALMRDIFSTTIPAAMGRQIQWFERPQILRYRRGSHYRLHADSERYIKERKVWQKTMDRDVSLLLYLNEDFSGGELSFFAMNYVFRPKVGDLLFFPSDHRYAHIAHEVTGGTRYVIVSWAAYADEPKVKSEPTWNSIAI